MSFKTQAEIYQALLNGMKLHHSAYDKKQYIHLINGNLAGIEGERWSEYFGNPSEWSIYEEPKKVTLYRYTYEDGKDFYQTLWRSKTSELVGQKILKTETKEVEI